MAGLASAALCACEEARAISLDEIPLWTGSGTNRAALVIEWSSPEVWTETSVSLPVADKTLVWGYRFNGPSSGAQMLQVIAAADPKLYVVADTNYGTFVEGIGYHLDGGGNPGITDGSATNFFTNGFLKRATVNVDAAAPLNPRDLYWGGLYGPNWEVWNEANQTGGFQASPNRGPGRYWTPGDTNAPYSGVHGQWQYAQAGLDSLVLTNGSWIGFSVAAGADDYFDDTDPGTLAFNFHKHAPPSPEGTYVAYECNTNDFAVEIVSTNNLYTHSPYNVPGAVLGRPTLRFLDGLGDKTVHRTKIVEPPYWTDPNTNDVITEISSGGQITVKLGRKVYNDPLNPYGVDLIVYGNSFFISSGSSGMVGEATDLNAYSFVGDGSIFGHPTVVSVSQDGAHWYTYASQDTLFPDNAYRWDQTNASWTDEQLNPTKPLNPAVYGMNFGGQSVAGGLTQFAGAAGGTGFDLQESGFDWIQYVRVAPQDGSYTVIDAIAAVNPAVVGDALSVAPANIASGCTNFCFLDPAQTNCPRVTLAFSSLSETARLQVVAWTDLSSLQPVPGRVLGGYVLSLAPLTGTNAVGFGARVGFSVGDVYSGSGADLELFQWNGRGWDQPAFSYDAASRSLWTVPVSTLSTFIVAQLPPVSLSIRRLDASVQVTFAGVANWHHTLERSSDLASWTDVSSLTPAASAPQTLTDPNPPADKAFYRLKLTRP